VSHRSIYDLGMERRSALKSMMAAFTAFAGRGFTKAAQQPSSATTLRSATMIETRDGTRLHFRDWGAGRPIVFVAPWGLSSDWWDAPVLSLSERGWRCVTFGPARSCAFR
jgi:non-heme chloroperoxidase